jgi:hypothetical protein
MEPGMFEKNEEFSGKYLDIYNRYRQYIEKELSKAITSVQVLVSVIGGVEAAGEIGFKRFISPRWEPARRNLYVELAKAVIECMPAPVRIEGMYLVRNDWSFGRIPHKPKDFSGPGAPD